MKNKYNIYIFPELRAIYSKYNRISYKPCGAPKLINTIEARNSTDALYIGRKWAKENGYNFRYRQLTIKKVYWEAQK